MTAAITKVNIKPSIYLLDSDFLVYTKMQPLIKAFEMDLNCFVSGNTLIEASQRCLPDCLIIEFSLLPDQGLSVYQSLQQLGIDPPTIFLANQSDIPHAVAAMRAGAIDFIEKPFMRSRLMGSIQKAIDFH